MSKFKDMIADLLQIETHEAECKRLQYERDSLAQQVADYAVKLDQLRSEMEFYKLEDDEKIKYMMEDVTGLADLYKQRISECDKMIDLAKQDADLAEQKIAEIEDRIKRAYSKGVSDGRISGFSEVGIWRLDALERGNRLVLDKDGNVYELLQDLEDVNEVTTTEVPDVQLADDEITIDDLVEVAV
jgi:DNA repair exonuclease SbcCD ATPase subunit